MGKYTVTAQQTEQILALYKTNQRIGEIARQVGLDRHAITQELRRFNVGYDPKQSRRRKFFYDQRYFEVIDNEEKAYFYGFLACDGSLKFENGNYAAVQMELNSQDREILKRFSSALGPTAPKVIERPSFNKSKIIFHSAQWCKDLIDKGFSHDKTFSLSDITKYVPKSLHRHFLRGVIDGDGYWQDEEYRIRFSIRGTDEFLLGLHTIIPVKTVLCGRGKWKSLVSTRHKEAVNFGDWLYENTDLYLSRKFVKFNSGRDRRRSRKTPNIGEIPEEGNPETQPEREGRNEHQGASL